MKIIYSSGRQARGYNRRWQTFLEQTLAETLALVDFDALHEVRQRLGRAPRLLDVACGTGVLLKLLAERVSDAELYGVDASAAMLEQAQLALKEQANVHLAGVKQGWGEAAQLPYAPHTFDLITCTNAFHELSDPVATLQELRRVLAPGGQLVLEDYARREPPFLWEIIEWLARQIEEGHVRAYTRAEAQALCRQVGLHVQAGTSFIVTRLWHGWALRLSEERDGQAQASNHAVL